MAALVGIFMSHRSAGCDMRRARVTMRADTLVYRSAGR